MTSILLIFVITKLKNNGLRIVKLSSLHLYNINNHYQNLTKLCLSMC